MPVISSTPILRGYLWDKRENLTPRLSSVTESRCAAGYIGQNRATEWLFDYSFTPFGAFQVGGADWQPRQAFEAHLYPPMTQVWEDTSGNIVGGQTRSIFINFTGGEQAGLLALTGAMGYARFLDAGRQISERLERLLQIGRELEHEGFWAAQGVLCEMIHLLLSGVRLDETTYLIQETPSLSPYSDFVRSVRSFLFAHIRETITLDMLAEHLAISVSALSHRYRQETGEAPIITLSKMRVALAKSLLLKGYRLKAIAAQTGFCDEYHLSRVFKQVEGISPRDFRKQRAGDIVPGS